MSWIQRRWRLRRDRDRDRAGEIEEHINLLADELVGLGRSQEDARREARLKFGNPRVKLEEVHDMNRLPILDTLTRDLSYAVRVLRRSPAFTLTAILTLGLAIGANSAVFSLADTILIRPLPYPEPDKLAQIVLHVRSPRGEDTDDAVDGLIWENLRDHTTCIDAAVYTEGSSGANVIRDNAAAYVQQQRVGAGFFRVLGISPAMGREFSLEEDRPGGQAVTVVSHDLWQRMFQGDPDIVGKQILLKGSSYQVIGVMPKGFRSTSPVDLWTPLRATHDGEGSGTNFQVIARLKPGVTWTGAQVALLGLPADAFRLLQLDKDHNAALSLRPLQEALAADVHDPIVMLIAAVGAVLLIACVNLAALLLARGGSRAKEMATRMALGSGRIAVVRQLMVESLVLAIAGGALGLLAGALGLDGLKLLGSDTFQEWTNVTLDGRIIAGTAALSLLTSVVFGLVPAWQASRLDVNAALVEGGTRSIAGGSRHWPRRALVVAEVALGVVLLVTAGLLMRTFVNLRRLDPGFDPSHIVTASVSLHDARYTTSAAVTHLFDGTIERLEREPGIESAAVSLGLPYQRLLNMGFRFTDEPDTAENQRIANVSYVTSDFFKTLRVPIRDGRELTSGDGPKSAPVVVVNETLARISSKSRNPVGRRLRFGGVEREIVGIAGNIQQHGSGFFLEGMTRGPISTTPTIYLPAAQTGDGFLGVHVWFSPVWSVRARSAAEGEAAIRRAVAAVDPLLPVVDVRSMESVMADRKSVV